MRFVLAIFIVFLLTNQSKAFSLYNCLVKQKTEIAICGYLAKCKDKNGKSYTRPIVHTSSYKASFKVVITEDEVSLKRVKNNKVFKFKKNKASKWAVYNTSENLYAVEPNGKTFSLIKGSFYFLNNLPFGYLYSGTCKKQ
tara:strand:- start:10 stop:429 length:420 start_codon:yes stop_codon:yes gene_type:complete